MGLAAVMYSQDFRDSTLPTQFYADGWDSGTTGIGSKNYDEWYVGLAAMYYLPRGVTIQDNTVANANKLFDYKTAMVCPSTPQTRSIISRCSYPNMPVGADGFNTHSDRYTAVPSFVLDPVPAATPTWAVSCS